VPTGKPNPAKRDENATGCSLKRTKIRQGLNGRGGRGKTREENANENEAEDDECFPSREGF